jgi:hypothetical protein
MNTTPPRFNSLEDFLISNPLTVDGLGLDGWGSPFPVKGCEIDATILFADIANFTGRTSTLSSTETLAFVNHFFAWITAEGLRDTHGIVDKYIGDEIMIVFSRAFGSDDPLAEAITAARQFGDHDAFAFSPHIGIACGTVTVGYVGTSVRYNCSVFGRPVAMAARCASVRPEGPAAVSIVLPADEWGSRAFDDLFPPRQVATSENPVHVPSSWEMRSSREVTPKNMSPVKVLSIEKTSFWTPSDNPEDWARRIVAEMQRQGEYRPA